MTNTGKRAVVNTGKGKLDTDLKKSKWVWRPKGNYLDHVSKDSGSFMLKKVEYVDPKGISKSVMAWIPKRFRFRIININRSNMFNSTLIGAAGKKYVKDPVEIHNIKQRDGETIEDFIERFKVETRRIKGAPECIRISGFMHGVNNPELTKRLNEQVPKTMEEMMTITTAFIRGEAAAASKQKGHSS
ncbi:hypothetical protein Tco_0028524 [Tanacetum coccineum]